MIAPVLLVLALGWGASVDRESATLVHEIHSTHTTVQVERGVLLMQIRTFADDFSASVARFAGREAPADSSVRPGEVERYVRAALLVTDARGGQLTLDGCGIERRADVYELCFRVAAAPGAGLGEFRNLLLTDLHADQVNIVQFTWSGRRRTELFTRTTAPVRIPGAG